MGKVKMDGKKKKINGEITPTECTKNSSPEED